MEVETLEIKTAEETDEVECAECDVELVKGEKYLAMDDGDWESDFCAVCAKDQLDELLAEINGELEALAEYKKTAESVKNLLG